MNSRDGLYFKFKRLLFDVKKVLLDDNGREKLPKDFDYIKTQGDIKLNYYSTGRGQKISV